MVTVDFCILPDIHQQPEDNHKTLQLG